MSAVMIAVVSTFWVLLWILVYMRRAVIYFTRRTDPRRRGKSLHAIPYRLLQYRRGYRYSCCRAACSCSANRVFNYCMVLARGSHYVLMYGVLRVQI